MKLAGTLTRLIVWMLMTTAVLPATSRAEVVAEGTHTAQYRPSVPPGSGVDAADAVFVASEANNYPVYLDSGTYLRGGTVTGNFDVAQSWSWFSNVGGTGLYLNLAQQTPFMVDGLRIDHHHDGIRLRRNVQGFVIRNVHMTNIRDDCIENDWYYSGVVENSLLDGCYVAFSARQGSAAAAGGPDETWEIRNSLVRQQAFPGPYTGPAPGHGPAFKLGEDADEGVPPKISLHGNIFRLDQVPNHGPALIPPAARIDSCSNNIVVWLGPGAFPGDLGRNPGTGEACFTVTTDASVWDNARADWLARHGSETTQPITLNVTPGKLEFAAAQGTNPPAKTLFIVASEASAVPWSANATAAWLSLSSRQGNSPADLGVNANASGLAAGTYFGTITISAPDAENSPVAIPVSLSVSAPVAAEPAITSPAPGGTLPGSTVTFTWSGNGTKVKKWQLYIGTTRGARNIHDSGKLNGSVTSRTVSRLPTGSRPVWVQLRFDTGGTWRSADFQYIAAP